MKEYKVGDWVITKGYCLQYDGKPLQIDSVSNDYYYYFTYNKDKDYRKRANFSRPMILRHALPHEIPVEFRTEESLLKTLVIW